MKKILQSQKGTIVAISALLIILVPCSSSFSRTLTQLTPTLTITEEYNDNYLKTENNKQEEFITSYGLGFSVGFLNKKSNIYLAYNPKYEDYKNFNSRDGFVHNASLDGKFTPSKFTNINAHLAYTSASQDNDYTGKTWENSALISGDSQLTKNTNVNFSQSYSNRFDEQVRTGTYNEHTVNRTSGGITNQFGEKDRVGANFSYEFDNYKNSDADEHTKYSPSGFITYWLTPLNGLDSKLAYEKTDFDTSTSDIETYTGHLRYLRKFSKHFDGYLKYRHSYSQRESGDHHIFHPSVGFDWEVTKDSGISLGVGLLFHKWDNNNNDSTDPFLDLDAYKIFNFSERGSLSITGSSGYSEAGDSAASLGYTTYYKAGFQLNYQLLKRVSSNLFGSYRYDEFHESAVNRKDNRLNLGGGLSWLPLKWLRFNASYSYTDFNTDTNQRGDYAENRATVSVSFIPVLPVRLNASPSRQFVESEIYN
ncbi:MAG: hypothetical protein KKE61_00030, partial [Proteobacteria bacterium]|nr:hypothetical protein [Pseudomonadota bacterium]